MAHGTNVDQDVESENDKVGGGGGDMRVKDKKERLIKCTVGHNKGGSEGQEQMLLLLLYPGSDMFI